MRSKQQSIDGQPSSSSRPNARKARLALSIASIQIGFFPCMVCQRIASCAAYFFFPRFRSTEHSFARHVSLSASCVPPACLEPHELAVILATFAVNRNFGHPVHPCAPSIAPANLQTAHPPPCCWVDQPPGFTPGTPLRHPRAHHQLSQLPIAPYLCPTCSLHPFSARASVAPA